MCSRVQLGFACLWSCTEGLFWQTEKLWETLFLVGWDLISCGFPWRGFKRQRAWVGGCRALGRRLESQVEVCRQELLCF